MDHVADIMCTIYDVYEVGEEFKYSLGKNEEN